MTSVAGVQLHAVQKRKPTADAAATKKRQTEHRPPNDRGEHQEVIEFHAFPPLIDFKKTPQLSNAGLEWCLLRSTVAASTGMLA